jgi:agmatine/peptidylarginine deiminase
MIIDNETDFVYFSELLKFDRKFPGISSSITSILDKYNIRYDFIKGTNDVWARDYMPIQVTKDKLIEYRYDPDYLQGITKGRRDLKTYTDIVCDSLKLKTIKTDILLDGGNVIKGSSSVILTDKIVEENKWHYKRQPLIEKLKQLFEVEKVILIPWDKEEDYGHADGMVRFINDNTVLVNADFDHYPSDFRNKFFNALEKNNISYEKLRFKTSKNYKIFWAYLNYLQMADIILLPKFGIEEDEEALVQFKSFFPEYASRDRIKQVYANSLAKEGGAFNCITWNIKT